MIAIDGGNSKTDTAIFSSEGVLLSLVRGPGMPDRLSERTTEIIGDLLAEAAAAAGLAPPGASGAPAAGGGPVALRMVACVANVDLPADERALEGRLASTGWAAGTRVTNDTYAVLRAGLSDRPAAGATRHWGVGVTCGTGINCVGVAPDGRSLGFLALGHMSGDWGGAGGLGAEAQWHAIRAADLRGPETALRELVPAHFGLDDPAAVAIAIHHGEISHSQVAGLAPLVFEAARAGDQIARDLVLRQAREIFHLIWSVARRLDLAGLAVPVVLGGGVIAAGDPLLLGTIESLVRDKVPGAEITVVRERPVVGAALLAMDEIGARAEAKARLRAEFAGRPEPVLAQR